jgi:hypothetical protein
MCAGFHLKNNPFGDFEVYPSSLSSVYLLRIAYFIRSFDKNPVFMRVREHPHVSPEK